MTTAEIVTSIDERLAKVKAEIAQLEGARYALIDSAPRRATRKPRRVRSRAAPMPTQIVPTGKLVALLHGSPGLSTSEMAKATNGKPSQVLALLRDLEKGKQIRRTGERRSTRWHLITDEDRVAARAAEIAAQSQRGATKPSTARRRRRA